MGSRGNGSTEQGSRSIGAEQGAGAGDRVAYGHAPDRARTGRTSDRWRSLPITGVMSVVRGVGLGAWVRVAPAARGAAPGASGDSRGPFRGFVPPPAGGSTRRGALQVEWVAPTPVAPHRRPLRPPRHPDPGPPTARHPCDAVPAVTSPRGVHRRIAPSSRIPGRPAENAPRGGLGRHFGSFRVPWGIYGARKAEGLTTGRSGVPFGSCRSDRSVSAATSTPTSRPWPPAGSARRGRPQARRFRRWRRSD